MDNENKIGNEEGLKATLARIEELWAVRPGEENWEERRSLVDLVEEYENENYTLNPPAPIYAIKFRMEQAGLSRRDLEPFLGSRSKVSEVLSGKRALSKEMIRKLHDGLGIPLKSLLGVQPDDPTGFVRVEWVLPATIVGRVTLAARRSGISEEEWVSANLFAKASARGARKTVTEIKIQDWIKATTFNPENECAA